MVSTKHCCYGTCNSDSRYYHKPHMQGVSFMPFPKPITQGEKCDRWALACGRKDFNRTKVTRNTYICTKHFVGGHGPTPENADPLPALAVPEKLEKLKRKRKAPTPHGAPVSKKQRSEAASVLRVLHMSTATRTSAAGNDELASSSVQSAEKGSLNLFENQVSREVTKHCACCQYSKENASGGAAAAAESSAAPTKKDQGTQTIYHKYILAAKIESIILKRQELPKKLK